MEQPQTHYQVSFTVRQALLLFVGLLLALGIAYFFGLMTGLTGRARGPEEAASAAAEPARTPAAEKSAEKAVRGTGAPAAARESARAPESRHALASPREEPTPPSELQLFEDGGEPTPAPARKVLEPASTPAAAAASAGEFWVQVLSVSSEREARDRSAKLARHNFHTAVVAGSTPRGKVYRVRVGPYRSREEASRAATLLQTREKVSPWIVPAGQ